MVERFGLASIAIGRELFGLANLTPDQHAQENVRISNRALRGGPVGVTKTVSTDLENHARFDETHLWIDRIADVVRALQLDPFQASSAKSALSPCALSSTKCAGHGSRFIRAVWIMQRSGDAADEPDIGLTHVNLHAQSTSLTRAPTGSSERL